MCYAQLIDVCSSASDSLATTSSRSHCSGRPRLLSLVAIINTQWIYSLCLWNLRDSGVFCVGHHYYYILKHHLT